MNQPEVRLGEPEPRQNAVGSLNQSLGQLTESVSQAVELAKGIQYTLTGQALGDGEFKAATAEPVRPLFAELENTVRINLGRIREISDILAAIREEIS